MPLTLCNVRHLGNFWWEHLPTLALPSFVQTEFTRSEQSIIGLRFIISTITIRQNKLNFINIIRIKKMPMDSTFLGLWQNRAMYNLIKFLVNLRQQWFDNWKKIICNLLLKRKMVEVKERQTDERQLLINM